MFFHSFIYNIADRRLRKYSIRRQNRDFYLESNMAYWVNNWNWNTIYKTSNTDTLISLGLYGLIGILVGALGLLQKLFWLLLN